MKPLRSSSTGICRFALQAFRSHKAFQWEGEACSLLIIGPNGSGKTNILEAVSLLTAGRGLRQARYAYLQAHDMVDVPWAISASFQGSQGPFDVLTTYREGERRLTKVEGVPLKTQVALADYTSILWLTPQMDGLFRGSESGRRRFLDRLVLGRFSHHGSHMLRYEKALTERHRLFDEPNVPYAWFEGIEKTLAEEAVKIMASRLAFLDQLSEVLAEPMGSFPTCRFLLEGTMEELFRQEGPEATRVFFEKRLATERHLHQMQRRTPLGPHQSKVQAFFPGDIPAHLCSTGQQKILLIRLILAACQLRFQRETEQRIPLLLLDDVVAHLDAEHRRGLFQALENLPLQVWLTGTDDALFKGCHAQVIPLS